MMNENQDPYNNGGAVGAAATETETLLNNRPTAAGAPVLERGEQNLAGGRKARIFSGKAEVQGNRYPINFSSDDGYTIRLYQRDSTGKRVLAFTIVADNLGPNSAPEIEVYRGDIDDERCGVVVNGIQGTNGEV